MGYLANFMVYTFAMVGVIVIALLVFKNVTQGGNGPKSKCLKVLDTMSLGPRKTLYIVSTGREKFLIAGDVDKTTLISKLETVDKTSDIKTQEEVQSTFQETMSKVARPSFMDKSNIGIKSSMLNRKSDITPVMQSLAEKIRK